MMSTSPSDPTDVAAHDVADSTSTAQPPNPVAVCDHDWNSITTAIRNGDPDAFEVVYNEFFDLLFKQIRLLTGRDESTCLDMVQDTFMKVIRLIKPVESHAHLTAWLRSVARTTAYDWLRKEARHSRKHLELEQGSGLSSDQWNSGREENAIKDQTRLLWIEQQLQELPAETRKMISLRYRMGWTLKQIGQKFGLKSGAVDGRIRRAVDLLRQTARDVEFEFEINTELGEKQATFQPSTAIQNSLTKENLK